jgi:predicted O-methyltransferase YrrM
VLTETKVRAWIDRTLPYESTSMHTIRTRTDELGLPHEELFASQVLLLRTLMLAGGVREVLELGTFLGYGTACFVEALDGLGGGHLTTVDRDEALSHEAQVSFPGVSNATTVDFVVGHAAEVCAAFLDSGRRFDLILLDVSEQQYPTLYETCIGLLRSGAMLVVDNVMMVTAEGWRSGENVIECGHGAPLEAMRELLAKAARDDRVWPSLVPLGSGILLCAKK